MARRLISTNRPDTLTQTFFIRQLFPCSRAADHTLTKFEFPAHAFGVDKIFDTLALRSIQWRHIVVLDGGIDCIQHQQWIDDTSRLFGSDLASTSDSAILRKLVIYFTQVAPTGCGRSFAPQLPQRISRLRKR